MAELVKQWNDGGSLTATYEGSGDGSAILSSDSYEGIDREMSVVFRDAGKTVAHERTVRQEGMRQRFITADGKVFCVLDGGRFGVLKNGGIEPPVMETYTRLTYIESTGEQYINLGYIVQEGDEIEIRYAATELESGRLFGTIDSNGNSTYLSFSSKNAYARFGSTKATTILNAIQSNCAILKKGLVSINSFSGTPQYAEMPTTPIYLFACLDNDVVTAYSSYRCMGFTIRKESGEIMELLPHRRVADGTIGMLDMGSGVFYENEGSGEFVAGAEIHLPNGYSLIDSVVFDADKLFDVATITQSDSIDIMYQRDYVSKSQYLYGVLSEGNTASFSAYMSATGAWRFGNQLVRPNTENLYVHRTLIANGKGSHDCSAFTLNKSVDFTTPDTFTLGGYRDVDGSTYATFMGKVYYIRLNDGDMLDWIPCVRISDGVEGFWDCVTQTFVEPL